MKYIPELYGISIEIFGQFNPTIFQPYWLFHNHIEDINLEHKTDVKIISPNVSDFSIDGVLYFAKRIQPNLNILKISSFTGPCIDTFDKVIKISQLLADASADAIEIGHFCHYEIKNEEKQKKIGQLIAPTKPWGEFGKEIAQSKTIELNGLKNLTLQNVKKVDATTLKTKVSVEPSDYIKVKHGIYLSANFRYELEQDNPTITDIVNVITPEFDQKINEAQSIFATILEMN